MKTLAGALAVAALCAPAAASAQTTGRISATNVISRMQGPEAVLDAALLRIWVQSERIGGKAVSFHFDGRSDVVLMETEVRFNAYCRGKLDDPACREGAVRNVALGQLAHLAGIYDAYVRLGDRGPGKSSLSIGRKTIYEAGLVTVDGLNYEKGFDGFRVGGFAGLAPDPLTRMVSTDYATAGGYYAHQGLKRWIRLGASGQAYLGSEGESTGLDRATLFNQNFFALRPGLSLATFTQIDLVPGPEERLIMVNLTYRPTGRYRIRFNLTRFRPIAFELSPILLNGLPDDLIVQEFETARTNDARFQDLPYGRPEVLPLAKLTSAVNQGKVVAHYITANSFTPYLSVQYRTRDIDGANEFRLTAGTYTYDPYDSGITARGRFQYEKGFDHDALRIGGWLEREITREVILGGGLDAAQVTYTGLDPVNVAYTKSANVYMAHAQARYERPTGMSFFAEGQYYLQARKRGSGEPGTQPGLAFAPPPESSSEVTGLVGITYRF